MKRICALGLVLTLLLGILTGCGAANENGTGRDDGMYGGLYGSLGAPGNVVADSAESVTQSGSSTNASGVQNQKLIRTMDISAETDDLDNLLAALQQRITELGGYVENKSVHNGSGTNGSRYTNMTVRIPVDRLDAFVEHISGATNVISYSEDADDVTLSYVATQSRIAALETEQARLLELLAMAENMDDLLKIEKRLTDVRTELEEVTSQLRLYDNLVDYGTVELYVRQVTEYTPVEEETMIERMGSGLKDNWKNLVDGTKDVLVFLVTGLPYLIPISIAAVIAWLAFKLAFKKKRNQAKQEDKD